MSSYKRTTIGCFIGIFTQAIITNLTAVLFVPMMTLYDLNYRHLGILVAVNFISQVTADLSFSKVIDRVGYRKIALPTCLTAACGLVLFMLSPVIFRDNVFTGILIATFIFAFSSGLLEILLSPIIAAIPGNDKGPAMSLMHSFYAWGQAAAIIITTLFVFIFGGEKWQIIVLFWTLIPLIAFMIFRGAPFPDIVPDGQRQSMSDLLFRPFYIFALLAIFFGAAAEIVMNQWTSTFMEKGLNLSKLAGDTIGMCGFAVMLGLGRTLYGIFGSKINIHNVMIGGSVLAFICYCGVALSPSNAVGVAACIICGIAVSLLWPGTIVIASEKYPLAGAWMFAILAAFGDIGGAIAPWITGEAVDGLFESSLISKFADILNIPAEQASLRFGILIAALFPLGAFICHIILKKLKRTESIS